VGIAYSAGAWALLQVIGFLADAFHWPDATKQVGAIVLAIGFRSLWPSLGITATAASSG